MACATREIRGHGSPMAIEPIDYARPQINRREPIRYGPTTSGFFIEIDPSPGRWPFNLILGAITIVMALSMLRVSFLLSACVVAGGFFIAMVERSQTVPSKYSSFELDGDDLIVHHDSRKDVL